MRLLDRLLHFTIHGAVQKGRRQLTSNFSAFCVVHGANKLPYMGITLLLKQMSSGTDMPMPHPVNTFTFNPPHFPSPPPERVAVSQIKAQNVARSKLFYLSSELRHIYDWQIKSSHEVLMISSGQIPYFDNFAIDLI